MEHSHPFGPEIKRARIEIIPLIDVIFFLLATFVLFTLSQEKIRDLEVVMPPSGDGTAPDDMLFLQASEFGTYYWKIGPKGAPEALTAAELRPRLENYKRSTERPRVIIRGDDKAKLGAAVLALDLVRELKIAEVSVETIPSKTGN